MPSAPSAGCLSLPPAQLSFVRYQCFRVTSDTWVRRDVKQDSQHNSAGNAAATKAIPKEMLPLVDKPLIQYVVNECIAAGITEIILVTHSSKNSIENHFDTSFELEAILEKRVKRQLLDEVQSICPRHVTIMQTRQGIAKGLGHAVLCARPMIGDEPFAVVLPGIVAENSAVWCSAGI